MKKFVSSLCVLAVALMAVFGGVTSAHAATYEEESDTVFYKAFEKVLEEEAIAIENIVIIKEPVYDLSLEQLGYLYSINIDQTEGFAIVINTDGIFELTEIFLDAKNPYKDFTGQKIYVSLMLYLVYENDTYIEPNSGIILDETAFELIVSRALYSAGYVFSNTSETIYYTNRTESKVELSKSNPTCYPLDLSNACVPAAGGNIIQYYTRFFPELIPGFTPGSALGNYYMYKGMTSDMIPVIATLYNYMGTNTTAPGTTIEGFKNGMTTFANEKGRNITYTSCMQNGNFNFDIAKQKFTEGQPIALFVDVFTVATLSKSTNSEYVGYLIANACHAMAGFGYNEITYTLTNGQTRTDKYIAVATGLTNQLNGFYNVNYNTQIDEAYSINMY